MSDIAGGLRLPMRITMKSFINAIMIAVFTVPATLAASACSFDVADVTGHDGQTTETQAEPRMIRTKECVESWCDYKIRKCEDYCNECMNLQYGGDGTGIDGNPCSHMCGSRCYASACASDTCYDERTGFEVIGEPDPELQKACEHYAAATHMQKFIDCRQLAIAQNPQLAEVYECLAEANEDENKREEDCPTVTARGTLGDEACEQLGSCDEKLCDPGVRDLNNQLEMFASSDSIVQAARDCLHTYGCENAESCLEDWEEALFGVHD